MQPSTFHPNRHQLSLYIPSIQPAQIQSYLQIANIQFRYYFSLMTMVLKSRVLLAVVCLAVVGRCFAQDAAGKADAEEGWTGWALNKLSEGIGYPDSDKAKNAAAHVVQKTADAASQSTDEFLKAAQDAAGGSADSVKQAAEKAKRAYDGTSEATKNKANDAINAASGTSGDAKSKADEAMKKANSMASGGEEAMKKGATDAYNKAGGNKEAIKQKASEAYNKAGDSAKQGKDKLNEAYESAKGKMSEKDKQALEQAKEKAKKAAA